MSEPGAETLSPEPQPSRADVLKETVIAGTQTAANKAAQRGTPDTEGNIRVAMSNQEKKDAVSSILGGVPGLENDTVRNKTATLVVDLQDRASDNNVLSDEEAKAFYTQFKDVLPEPNRYQAEQILSITSLSPTSRQKILDLFPEMAGEDREKAEKDDELPQEEREQRVQSLDALNDTAGEIESQLTQQIDKIPDTQVSKDEKEQYKRKLNGLRTRISDYFAEGEPGREYARKGKKWAYYILVTAIVLMLMEMNLIYKAAAGRKK